MSRVRVSDIGKELGIETKAILAQLNKMGVVVKNHLSTISDTDAIKLRSAFKTPTAGIAKKPTSKIFIRRKTADIPLSSDESLLLETENMQLEETSSVPSYDLTAGSSDQLTSEKHEESTNVHNIEPQEMASIEESITKEEAALHTEKTSVPETQESTPVIEVKSSPHENKDLSESMQQSDKKEDKVALKSIETENAHIQQVEHPQKISANVPQQNIPKMTPTSSSRFESKVQINPKKPDTFQSATIIRRGAPENVYQVNMTRQTRSNESNDTGRRFASTRPNTGYSTTQRPNTGYSTTQRPNTGYSTTQRPNTGYSATQRPNTGYLATQSQKSFVMPDSMPPIGEGAKDYSARGDKNRGKDREKRRSDDEIRANKIRSKGAPRYYEQNEYEDESTNFEANDESFADAGINVRTIVSNKKRKSAFKRKETSETIANPTKASKKIIRVDEHISVNDLALEMSVKVAVIIKSLMKLGMLATANKVLDFDTATLVANEFGFETQNVTVSLKDIISKDQNKLQVETVLEPRPPIITIMGHVDHGKTSLLDALRKTNVVAFEAGGITQHIGAYQISYQNRKLTFLDTPGHEAFTEMRARGSKITDIVILVVAADDGVMPQTIEAIAHAKAANVPIIVAINKIDKPNINLDRLNRELAEQGVISEEWGGDSIFIKVSAKTGEGLDKLIEAILLQAEILDLKASATGFAEGVVIEAKRDKSRGPVATVIITKGLLKQQDSIVVGKTMGRIRAMQDDKHVLLKEATPGSPVEIIGLNDVPDAGDIFYVVASDAIAREAVAYKLEKHRQAQLASQKSTNLTDLQTLFEQQEITEKPNELNLIIKADTHGSIEAIKVSLQKLDTQKVKNKVILASVGGISETDVVLADASHAIIIGFNVRADKIASQRAELKNIKMMYFNIIYELIDAVKVAMAGTLAPVQQDKIIGHAEVRNLFTVPKVGVIAGCLVTDGKIVRPCRLRVIRDSIVGYTGALASLKRFKDDAKEVLHGFECGIGVENYNDLKIGDVLEAYVIEEIAAEL